MNDGELNSIPDEVIITASTPNVAPNANAGADQNVFTGTLAQLDGSASNDPDNGPQPLSYLWSFISGPAGSSVSNNSILNRDKANAGFIPDVYGPYAFQLKVNDGALEDTDTVSVDANGKQMPMPALILQSI